MPRRLLWGSAIAQEDVELVTAVVWSTFLHTLCHAVYFGPAWIIWTAVLLIISSTFSSMPHNYSSMSLLHTTSRSTSTPPRRRNVPLYDYIKAIFSSLKTSAHASTGKHVQHTCNHKGDWCIAKDTPTQWHLCSLYLLLSEYLFASQWVTCLSMNYFQFQPHTSLFVRVHSEVKSSERPNSCSCFCLTDSVTLTNQI